MTARAVYDPALGYPLEVSFSWVVRANWRHPDFWEQVLATGGLPRCRNTTFVVMRFCGEKFAPSA
jgi:hypothetical protein